MAIRREVHRDWPRTFAEMGIAYDVFPSWDRANIWDAFLIWIVASIVTPGTAGAHEFLLFKAVSFKPLSPKNPGQVRCRKNSGHERTQREAAARVPDVARLAGTSLDAKTNTGNRTCAECSPLAHQPARDRKHGWARFPFAAFARYPCRIAACPSFATQDTNGSHRRSRTAEQSALPISSLAFDLTPPTRPAQGHREIVERIGEIKAAQQPVQQEALGRAIDEASVTRAGVLRMLIEDRNLAREKG
jgi:hypothetical protein